jgi:hypothetical protein
LAHAVVGTAILGLVVLGGAGLAAALHVALRPRSTDDVRPSSALRDLEPRGGRQRFHVRLFEVVVLLAAWATGLPVLAVYTVVARTEGVRASALVVALALGLVTWWAWRRGTLRAPNPASEAEAHDG